MRGHFLDQREVEFEAADEFPEREQTLDVVLCLPFGTRLRDLSVS